MVRLPIIYVRGFAGNTSGIDEAVDDPFYGFNAGSTHVRVGGDGDPLFYQFESPLLRLMIDHGYRLFVEGGQEAWLRQQPDGKVDPASIWIHRFYDVSASTFGERPQAFDITHAAKNLGEWVDLVRDKTGAERVHLVAHSMGGLICRCLIQKVLPDAGRRAGTASVGCSRMRRRMAASRSTSGSGCSNASATRSTSAAETSSGPTACTST